MRPHGLSRRTGLTAGVCAAALLLTGVPAAGAPPIPGLRTIDLTIPGTEGSVVDINRRGLIAGSFRHADGEARAVLWAHPDRPRILGGVVGSPNSLNDRGDVVGGDWVWQRGTVRHLSRPGGHETARFVNNRGQVAGSRVNADGLSTAFRWYDGRFTDIGPAGWHSRPSGLNDRGDVIGIMFDQEFVIARGFIWRDGVLTVIDAGDEATFPEAVNELGEVVGSALFPGYTGPEFRPFRWAHGTITDLMPPGERTPDGAYATAINDAGDIVGQVDFQAVLWRDGRMVTIRPAGLTGSSRATAINERGDVGGNFTWATSGIVHRSAFRWRAGTVLLSEPVTGDGGVSVAGIDDHGRLAGTIRDGAGGSRAVTWRP
ncbi:MAG TPA: hypothetical protein VF657_15655 [Actinoplanes sp.]